MLKLIDSITLPIFIVLCLTLGMAPFLPEPHLVEKIRLLSTGELNRMIDIFDLLLHGMPWVLLLMKLALIIKTRQTVDGDGWSLARASNPHFSQDWRVLACSLNLQVILWTRQYTLLFHSSRKSPVNPKPCTITSPSVRNAGSYQRVSLVRSYEVQP